MCTKSEGPALQVIILGSGGGPREDNTTAFLVRSTAAEWRRGSVLAVDAGTHLAAICRLLEPYVKDAEIEGRSLPVTLAAGPFQGLSLPYKSADANAMHITRYLVDTYLITHPHLDHMAGFVINTAGLPGVRPKRLAGLPSTISAFKNHIFNNVIWPNLTDENDGVGLVTYMRLVDGGSPALGDGEGKGYVEVCEGLTAKALSVSHGHCMEHHSHRGSHQSNHPHDYPTEYDIPPSRSNSHARSVKSPEHHDRRDIRDGRCIVDSSAYFIRDVATGREVLIFGDVEPDSISLYPRNLQVWTAAAPKIASGLLAAIFIECSYTDSQNDDQLYGHLAPRFLIEEMKTLAGCVETARQDENDKRRKKRKRPHSAAPSGSPRRSPRLSHASLTPERRRSVRSRLDTGSRTMSPHSDPSNSSRSLDLDGPAFDIPISPHTSTMPNFPDRSGPATLGAALGIGPTSAPSNDVTMSEAGQGQGPDPTTPAQPPLKGLKVVIIHVKDKLDDAEPAGEVILEQMLGYEEEEKLGIEYVRAGVGMSVYL